MTVGTLIMSFIWPLQFPTTDYMPNEIMQVHVNTTYSFFFPFKNVDNGNLYK